LERIKVGAVFVNFRRPDLLLQAVNSLETTHQWRLFVIDNATLKLPSLAAAWNRGIEAAVAWGAGRILVSNDDVLFHLCTIDHLVERAVLKDYGFLCPTDVGSEHGAAGLASLPTPVSGEDRQEASYSCFVLSPDLYREIGPFDEGFTPAYFEDTDYNLRLGLAGRPGMTTTYAPSSTTAAPAADPRQAAWTVTAGASSRSGRTPFPGPRPSRAPGALCRTEVDWLWTRRRVR